MYRPNGKQANNLLQPVTSYTLITSVDSVVWGALISSVYSASLECGAYA